MRTRIILVLLVVTACAAWAHAQTPEKAQGPPAVTVAILDYQAASPGNPDLGLQIAEILTARLSIEDSFQLVERSKLGSVLEEQKLKLAGIVDQDQAVKVGKLVGAKLMVMGKGFMMDKRLFIVTKVVGVETGLVKGTIRTVELSKPLSEAIMLLADDIRALIKKNAATLLPKGVVLADPIAAIRKKLPKVPATVAVVIPEQHRTRRPAPALVDPAVETEIKKVLLECGYKLVDAGQNDLADWAKDMIKGKGKDKPWPVALTDADIVVVGEAFSEFALRTGDLVTCAARAEVNVIDRHSGKILQVGRETQRAVDLAEAIAGKTALQKAGHKLGVSVAKALLEYKVPAKAADKEGSR